MSKFDILAHGDLNRYSAMNLKEILWKLVGKDGAKKSWYMADLDVKWAPHDNPSSLGFVGSIIYDDCGVFIVASEWNGMTMKCMKIRNALPVLSNVIDHEKPLIIVNIKNKRLHQVIDHAADAAGVVLLLDSGDMMSDEISHFWSSSGQMGKYV